MVNKLIKREKNKLSSAIDLELFVKGEATTLRPKQYSLIYTTKV